MKRQTDLTKQDLSRMAIKHFRCLSERHGRSNVTGGEWYVRLGQSLSGKPLLLLVIPVSIRRYGEWHYGEDVTVVA